MKFFGRKKEEIQNEIINEVKTEKKMEAKSSGSNYVNYLFETFGYGIEGLWLNPITAYRFYHKISPLQGTISKICDAIGSLPIGLRSEKDPDEFTKDSDVIRLLNNPSPLMSKKQFLTLCAQSLSLTRELWIVGRGLESQPPQELSFIHPYNVQVMEDAINIWPIEIYTNINGDRRYYYREEKNGRYRYFDKTRLNEMHPFIAEKTSIGSSGFFRGISPVTSIKDELLSYAASIVGNTASIENSGRPSGVISPKNDNMEPEQYDDLQESLENITGAGNSGKVLLVPFTVEAAFPEWAPKDMDYATLQANIKNNIWNLYSMPFPIVDSSGQTYSNFSEAQTAFYDEAVNETFEILGDALKWMLSTKYDLDGQMISYNPLEVPALKRRAIAQMKIMSESQSLEVNEIRNSAGYNDNSDGDVILVASGKTTLDSVVQGALFEVEAQNTLPKE